MHIVNKFATLASNRALHAVPGNQGAFIHEALPESDVLHVLGDVDMSNKQEFEAALTALAQSSRPMVVNLTQCTYIDSSALNVLARVYAWVGVRLQIVISSHGAVRRIFDITGLGEAFDALFEVPSLLLHPMSA